MRELLPFIAIALTCAVVVRAQYPQRLAIPGAVLLQQPKPVAYRQPPRAPPSPNENYPVPLPVRVRKPISNAPPPPPPRPVIEDNEEADVRNTASSLEEEVARLAFQNVVRSDESDETSSRPVLFRPERPVPILRENVREPAQRPPPNRPPPQQEAFREIHQAPRPQARQHAPPPQPIRQAPRVPAPRPPAPQYLDEQEERANRNRKPPVQILRKYRTDNEDGSITWGYENEDGSFKEETIGADCVIRGKYGYVDPDGVRREYDYETGNKCDPREQQEEELRLEGVEQQLSARPPPPPRKQQQYRIAGQ